MALLRLFVLPVASIELICDDLGGAVPFEVQRHLLNSSELTLDAEE